MKFHLQLKHHIGICEVDRSLTSQVFHLKYQLSVPSRDGQKSKEKTGRVQNLAVKYHGIDPCASFRVSYSTLQMGSFFDDKKSLSFWLEIFEIEHFETNV
jgi:hypothetical protein